MMQRVYDNSSYANAIEIYLDRVNCDVWTVEMHDRNDAEIDLFAPWKGKLDKKVAIGAVSHRTLQAESPKEVADSVRNALRYIDLENLILSSDCGFGRQGAGRTLAFYKAAALAQGANIIRREQGLPETYVPVADERLAPDVIPARFEE
jgi:5-methyltetrahydropteroyltriglutamate--homocysteine methyltransferase